MHGLDALPIDQGLLRSFEAFYEQPFSVAHRPIKFSKSASFSENAVAHAAADAGELSIAGAFGKHPNPVPSIGDHPDFLHLKGTDDVCYCPITTMFMDIESSTRLSLLYPLEDVRRIKNAFIQTAIQIMRCFEGHVHRIMGDAVMAYFGGPGAKVEDTIINGINCAAILRHFAAKVVVQKLKAEGYDHDFGIRIGLDHGPHQQVLWSSYGFPGMDEVTATSYYVDVASKLQHAAGRNHAMLGQSLIETIDLPTELTFVKTSTKNGVQVEDGIVMPNLTNGLGQSINYRQRQLAGDDYLLCTRVGQQFHGNGLRTFGVRPLDLQCTVHSEKGGAIEGVYYPASKVLPKKKYLRFTFNTPYVPSLPYTVACIVENHGSEAASADPKARGNHTEFYTVQSLEQHLAFCHWEHTAYRGLHYMTVEIREDGRRTFVSRFGVYVE